MGTPGVQTNSVRIAYQRGRYAGNRGPGDRRGDQRRRSLLPFSASVAGQTVTINGSGASVGGLSTLEARMSASLAVDPGVVVKLLGSRIETEMAPSSSPKALPTIR